MKRRALIRELTKAGCYPKRPGEKHDVYVNPKNERKAPVMRHPSRMIISGQLASLHTL